MKYLMKISAMYFMDQVMRCEFVLTLSAVLLFSGCGSSCWLWEVWVFGMVCGVGWESWYWNIHVVQYVLLGVVAT